MTLESYASNKLPFYPGRNLSVEETRRMDAYETRIGELTADQILYSMSRQIENNFMTFYTVAQELIGEEKSLEIAAAIGTRYGGLGYATMLKAMGLGKYGRPTQWRCTRISCTRRRYLPNATTSAVWRGVTHASIFQISFPRTASTLLRSSKDVSPAIWRRTRT